MTESESLIIKQINGLELEHCNCESNMLSHYAIPPKLKFDFLWLPATFYQSFSWLFLAVFLQKKWN